MWKLKNIVVGVVGACSILALGSCSTNYLSQPSSPLQINTVANLKPNVEVGSQIEGTATVSRICYFFITGPGKFAEGVNYGDNYKAYPIEDSFWGDTIAEAKAAAAYRACVENKADFIVCPRYYIIVNTYPFYTETKVKVYGYKGVLKGVTVPETLDKNKPLQIEINNPVKLNGNIGLANPVELSQPIELKQPIEMYTKEKTSAKESVSPNNNPDSEAEE